LLVAEFMNTLVSFACLHERLKAPKQRRRRGRRTQGAPPIHARLFLEHLADKSVPVGEMEQVMRRSTMGMTGD
jgi:hypothetical protein